MESALLAINDTAVCQEQYRKFRNTKNRGTDTPPVHPPLTVTCRQVYYEAISMYYTSNAFFLQNDALEGGMLTCLRRISTTHNLEFNTLIFHHIIGSYRSTLILLETTTQGLAVKRIPNRRRTPTVEFWLGKTPKLNVCLCGLTDLTTPASRPLDFMFAYLERSLSGRRSGPRRRWCRKCRRALVFCGRRS